MAFDAARRFWERLGPPAILTILAVGGAFVLHQTNGALLSETYALLSTPFRPKINRDMALSTAANQELRAQVEELKHQNHQLQELLQVKQEFGNKAIPAAVVARGADRWWQHLTLSKGTNHNVEIGHVVMAPGGLVGRVESVSANTSRVLLVSDPTSRVGVILGRSRAMGILQGLGSDLARIEFFDRMPDIQVGDVVLSSGLGSRFPGGLVIGHVRSIDLNATPAPTAFVQLSAPIGLLEWGVIYSHHDLNHESK